MIEELLGDFFNYNETDIKVYNKTRLKNFLGLVNSIMEAQLGDLVHQGHVNFLQLLYFNVIEHKADKLGRKVYSVTRADENVTQGPFLTIRITLKTEGGDIIANLSELNNDLQLKAGNGIVLYPSLDQVADQLTQLLEAPYSNTDGCIPHIESLMMTKMGGCVPFCQVTHSPEFIESGKAAINEMVQGLRRCIESLFQKYKQYEFLVQNDPCKVLSEESTLEQFAEPVQRLNSARKAIQGISQNGMEFSPFLIDCSVVKNIYMNLSQKAMDKIGGILANRISVSCNQMLSVYDDLNFKLTYDPGLDVDKWSELETSLKSSLVEFDGFNEQVF